MAIASGGSRVGGAGDGDNHMAIASGGSGVGGAGDGDNHMAIVSGGSRVGGAGDGDNRMAIASGGSGVGGAGDGDNHMAIASGGSRVGGAGDGDNRMAIASGGSGVGGASDDDELRSFRFCLRLMCVDRSSVFQSLVSWSLFLLLGIAVPAVSFILDYSPHHHPYDSAVQLSLTLVSALAFLRLSALLRRYGLRRLLFLDKLPGESHRVRIGYTTELSRSFCHPACFFVPCTAVEAAYKVWWYCAGSGRIPFLGNATTSDIVAFTLELASWVYRTGSFFLVCVLFRVICKLQILRLQDFAAVFREESEVATVLREHLRIRRQLTVISHRFRSFIVGGLVLVTASLLGTLLLTTRPHAEVNVFNGGELALCSVELVAGILICLRSAAIITHRAQALKSHAAAWHVCATINCYKLDPETPSAAPCDSRVDPVIFAGGESDEEDIGAEDELEDGKMLKPQANTISSQKRQALEDEKMLQPQANTISFQKRQALVTYLENNTAGITVFGIVLDRTYLHNIFMLELSLVLWLLGKTIGLS